MQDLIRHAVDFFYNGSYRKGGKSNVVFVVGITDTQYAVFRVARVYSIRVEVDIYLVMVGRWSRYIWCMTC